MADASNENAAKKRLEAILARIGRKFDTSFEPLSIDGADLQVLSIHNMQAHLDALINSKAIKNPLRDLPLWAKIWPASFVLGRYLRKFGPEGKSLLEIGCGCGICSLVAAVHGFAKITMGDIVDDALDFARAKPRFAKLAKEKFRVSENRIGVKAIDEEGKSRVRGYEILILERKTDAKM